VSFIRSLELLELITTMLLSSFVLLVVLVMHQSCLNEVHAQLHTHPESETQSESEEQSESETQSESEEQSESDEESDEHIDIGERAAHPTTRGIIFPDNIAAVVGSEVILTCRGSFGSNKIQWQFLAVGSTIPLTIVDKCKVDSRHVDSYRVDDTDKACNLVLDSVTLELAGTYSCSDRSQRSFTASSRLIVLAAEPACKTSADGQKKVKTGTDVTFTCSVQYSGAAAPAMQFLNEFEEVMPVNSVTSTSTHVETSFVTNAGYKTIRPYTAKTYFNAIVLPPAHSAEKMKFRAENVPDYVYKWTSLAFAVSP